MVDSGVGGVAVGGYTCRYLVCVTDLTFDRAGGQGLHLSLAWGGHDELGGGRRSRLKRDKWSGIHLGSFRMIMNDY